jgi:mono/diheme cytochrome c family protein
MLKFLFVLPAALFFALLPQEPAAPPAPAPAPAAAPILTNPVTPTPESQAHAKSIYSVDCAMCHGEKGNGKGDLVSDMGLKMKDWTDSSVLKDMSDGEIYNVIQTGRGKMPAEAGRAKDTDVWNLVILVRSFGKK